ncbi:MAG TPA: TetR/AcrR family transcriptional regulator [Micropepsaceae bacterium]|nr:TetR/AcrR family transcriptional regulator [Micropepsaceae bacterium]
MVQPESGRAYHHGDLKSSLREAASAILEEEGLSALSLRSVARRAGVSHAAPYRHYPSREALLADIAVEGLERLRGELAQAASVPGDRSDRIVRIGGAYLRFASRHAGLLRLIFGSELPNRGDFPGLAEATAAIGEDIGLALGDQAAGLAVWAAMHGLAILILENVIDLGQKEAGLAVAPSRAEILLRSLVEVVRD